MVGSAGAIGTSLAKHLADLTNNIRLVSRNPRKVNESDLLFKADLTNPAETLLAVEGSSICYLTVSREYKSSVWQQYWPVIIRNVTEACMTHKRKLVFLDNMYALDTSPYGQMTEQTPIKPSGKKVR
jgi:uncharacterized protein YbjT (DUF2867 family)